MILKIFVGKSRNTANIYSQLGFMRAEMLILSRNGSMTIGLVVLFQLPFAPVARQHWTPREAPKFF